MKDFLSIALLLFVTTFAQGQQGALISQQTWDKDTADKVGGKNYV